VCFSRRDSPLGCPYPELLRRYVFYMLNRTVSVKLLNAPLQKAPLVFIDTETTGLRPDIGHRVVEVAALRTIGLEKAEEFSSLINPQRTLDPGAMAVNGITPEMIADAPLFADIVPQLNKLLDGAVIVAHNAPFDMNFLASEYAIAGQSFAPDVILDTLMLARRQYYFPSNSLGNIARTLNIPTPDAHRALGDVLTTFAVFRRFSGDLARKARPLVNDWLRMQGGIVWQPQAGLDALADNHPIRIALTEKRQLRIKYRSNGGAITERIIEPRSFSGQYLVAYCHLRQDQRTFRLDNIVFMELLDV